MASTVYETEICGGEIRDTKTLNLSRNKNICCGLKKVVAKSRARVYFGNKFWLCCSFFMKLTTCRATNLLVP